MHLVTNVKIGEVSHLSDARYAAGSGANFVGFCLSPRNENYIEPAKVKEITGWIEGITPVAEWYDEPADVIADTCRHLGILHIQMNAFDPGCSEKLKDFTLIQNIVLEPNESPGTLIEMVDKIQHYTKYYMLTFREPGSQNAFLAHAAHEQMIVELCRDYPVFLNFHFKADALRPMLDKYHPFGINLKGGPEDKPGLKDFDELNELVEALQS
jgi:phosphoribosylanthranilate isomerase